VNRAKRDDHRLCLWESILRQAKTINFARGDLFLIDDKRRSSYNIG